MAKNGGTRQRPTSGAAGGPGASSGFNYQVDFAVLQALESISSALVNPLKERTISMEPRITGGGIFTCWDVRTSPPEVVTEAKSRPKRDEILNWLDYVELGTRQTEASQFELFYGRGAPGVVNAIDRLCRIAQEANGDASKFQSLVALESNKDFDLVLECLKTNPHKSLLRVRLTPLDPNTLGGDISFRLRHLVREQDGSRLYDFLVSKFHKGIEQRATFRIRDLIEETQKAGIEFYPPPVFESQDLDPVVSGAIFILQNCATGLPAGPLAAALNCSIVELELLLSSHISQRVLFHEEGLWTVARFKPPLTHEDGPSLLARALSQLLEFIRANKQNVTGWSQVANAVALGKACQSDDPELVSGLFWRLDKLLKRTGDKHLVLEVANLSISAAHRHPRTETKAKGEAVALICGRSWVYQRIDRLGEARVDGEKSLQLGKDIGWDRNSVYCLKCLGRLVRMEAQRDRQNPSFKELLAVSIKHLEDAIAWFPKISDLSERERISEAGDCFSLLGRSYLVAGDLVKAEAAARSAIDRITDKGSKDYADLQILLGDLARAKRDRNAALGFYDEAIGAAGADDAEKSEIAARAHFQKGLLAGSTAELDTAARIWAELDEDHNADEARWHSMKLSKKIPPGAEDMLKAESSSVRVEAFRLHAARLETLGQRFRGRRLEPDKNYWRDVVLEAKKNVAVRHQEW
jgi:hypothetical protein